MKALCEALDERRPTRLFRALSGGLLLSAAALVGVAAARLGPQRQDPCQGAASALVSVWDPARRAAVERRFLAEGGEPAQRAWGLVSRHFDEYARQYVAHQTEVCEATMRRAQQSQEMMDLRMQCLREHLSELRALSDLLLKEGREGIVSSAWAVTRLSSLEECGPERLLRAGVRLPRDPETRRQVERLRARLAEVTVLIGTGRPGSARSIAEEVLAASAGLGYGPLQAEALLWLGRVQVVTDPAPEAERTLYRALHRAEATGHASAARAAWETLFVAAGTAQARYDDAHRIARHIEAYNERLGDDSNRHELERKIGEALIGQGRYSEALGHFRSSLQWIDERGQGSIAAGAAHALLMMGTALHLTRRYEEVMDCFERALRIRRQHFREDHSRIAAVFNNMGAVHVSRGELVLARPLLERALEIRQRSQDATRAEVALVLQNLAVLERKERRFAEARAALLRTLAIRDQSHGADHPLTADALHELGLVYRDQGAPAQAAAQLERALRIREARSTPPEQLGETRFALAQLLHRLGGARERIRALGEGARAAYQAADPAFRQELAAVERWLQGQGS